MIVEPNKVFLCRKSFELDNNLEALKLTKTDKRLFNLLIGSFTLDVELYKISVKSIKNYYQLRRKDIYTALRKTTEKLATATITISSGKNYKHIPIFSSIGYENGWIIYSFNNDFVNAYIAVSGNYITYELQNIKKLSNYTIRLYEILRDKLNKNNRYLIERNFIEYSFEELRKELKIPKSYTPAKIVERIIKPAQNELKDTDINFQYKVVGNNLNKKLFIRIKENSRIYLETKYFQNEKTFVGFLKQNYINRYFFVFRYDDKLLGVRIGSDKMLEAFELDQYLIEKKSYYLDTVEVKKIFHSCYELTKRSEAYKRLLLDRKCFREEKMYKTDLYNQITFDIIDN